MDNMTGKTVFGNWKVIDLIGEGGYGKVYKIERDEFGIHNVAALKVLTVPFDASEEKELKSDGYSEDEAEKFLMDLVAETVKEVALMCELKGKPNIVGYEDHYVERIGEEFRWNIYVRMEYLSSLSDYFMNNGIRACDILKLGVDICSALEICHEKKIIHRDIKPENIMVSENGDFKLGDFGIARTMERTVGAFSKKGTYSYMAPEVYSGKEYSDNVDIYSLGLVLYRLFNRNKLPFIPLDKAPSHTEKEQALLSRMSGAALPAPIEADEIISRIILKACAFNPEMRYRTASEMKADLLAVLGGVPGNVRAAAPAKTPGETVTMPLNPAPVPADAYHPEVQNNNASPIVQNNNDPETKKSAKKLIIVFCAVAAVIAVLLIFILGSNKGDDKKTTQPSTQNTEQLSSLPSDTENTDDENDVTDEPEETESVTQKKPNNSKPSSTVSTTHPTTTEPEETEGLTTEPEYEEPSSEEPYSEDEPQGEEPNSGEDRNTTENNEPASDTEPNSDFEAGNMISIW